MAKLTDVPWERIRPVPRVDATTLTFISEV
jgi:hypothetical protein